jgi:mono/diheme cytochrome c family protein
MKSDAHLMPSLLIGWGGSVQRATQKGAGRGGLSLVIVTLTSLACLMLSSHLLGAQSAVAGGTVWDGIFTEAQAARGAAAYGRSCASCHKEDLLGGGSAPALAGAEFFRRWNDSTVDDVVQTTRSSMPQDAPNSLDAQSYVDIVTYLLKASGSPAGSAELTADRDRLKLVRVSSAPSR